MAWQNETNIRGPSGAQGAPGDLTQATADTLYVKKPGDTMTGNLEIAPPSGSATFQLVKAASGSATYIRSRVGANARWLLNIGDGVAESGSDAGSNFAVARYSDAGALLGTPLSIARSTGIVALAEGATTLAPAAADSSTRIPTTAWVAGELATANALKVNKAGDTMTGTLNITPASGSATLNVNANTSVASAIIQLRKGAGAFGAYITSQTGSTLRWALWLGDSSTESGSDTGSDFVLNGYNDAGAAPKTALRVPRTTGIVAMGLGATTLAPAAADSSTRIPTTAWVAGELATANALQVLKAGDTMTGNLTIAPASGSANLTLNRPVAGTTAVAIVGQTVGIRSWHIQMPDGAGNFVLTRSNASGVVIDSPISVQSATGIVSVSALASAAGIGVYGVAPVARGALALPTGTIQRTTYVTSSVTLPQLAGVVMAIITDLRSMGFFS